MSLSAAVATPTSLPAPPPGPVTPATVRAWQAHRDEAAARLEACRPATAVRDRAQAYVDGLRSDVPRKNGGQRAEVNGDATPYAMPHLLGRAHGSVEEAGAGLYDYVIDHLGDEEGVAILDETGFRKKGVHSAGVARPYSGTAGKIANCQVGVFLAYAGARGDTRVDRALSLPRAGSSVQARGKPWAWPPTRPSPPSRNWPAGGGRGRRRRVCPWPG